MVLSVSMVTASLVFMSISIITVPVCLHVCFHGNSLSPCMQGTCLLWLPGVGLAVFAVFYSVGNLCALARYRPVVFTEKLHYPSSLRACVQLHACLKRETLLSGGGSRYHTSSPASRRAERLQRSKLLFNFAKES